MSPPDIADLLSFIQSIYHLPIIKYYSFVINIDHLIIYARQMYPTSKNIAMHTVAIECLTLWGQSDPRIAELCEMPP